ncbi:PadR family transcriptional regulator [Nicoliella lavandulae]|uniref:PadR family transcriptional regulator n=1 Tax=Nicoliella lavandulae TaxID=3082954 RepID=A0ABU8SJ33_9LACO
MKGKDIILGLLNSKGPLTGYEINEILQNQFDHFYEGSYGMIYPTLRTLENNKCVKKEKVSQEGKPNKNIFSILPLGEKELKKALHTNLEEDEFKSDFLMKMYFGVNFSKNEKIKLIEKQINMKQHKLDLLKLNLKKWKNNGMNNNHKFTYDYGIVYYSSSIDFLKKELSKLQNYD